VPGWHTINSSLLYLRRASQKIVTIFCEEIFLQKEMWRRVGIYFLLTFLVRIKLTRFAGLVKKRFCWEGFLFLLKESHYRRLEKSDLEGRKVAWI
jgi:hypothetical protein